MVNPPATTSMKSVADGSVAHGRNGKSPGAFRTIREAADELGLPQHVLRFWESKFLQIRPLKRGGGRRYYRPADIALLMRIRDWLHVEGYTIKGVQKLLRDSPPQPDTDERAANPASTPAMQAGIALPVGPADPALSPTPPENTRDSVSDSTLDDAVDDALQRLRGLRDRLGKTFNSS